MARRGSPVIILFAFHDSFTAAAVQSNYTPEKYQAFQKRMAERCGMEVPFRLARRLVFPKALLDQMSQYGKELMRQLDGLEYRKASFAAIPPEFNVPRETPHPMFIQVDFGLVRDAAGNMQPKLVELQAFPSLYAYQAMLSQTYMEVFGLPSNSRYLLGGLDWESYIKLLKQAVLGDQDPENVILMEIDPLASEDAAGFPADGKNAGNQDGRHHGHQEGWKLSSLRNGGNACRSAGFTTARSSTNWCERT